MTLKALMLMALCVMTTHAAQAEVVDFPDKNLEAAIRKAINKPTGGILDTDLLGIRRLTSLHAARQGITDLTGLEYCKDLTQLRLTSNDIRDLSALSGLTNLQFLWLSYNQISDLSALSGLTNLMMLDLNDNQIRDISALAGLTNLNNLYLTHNQISDLNALAGLANLRELYLDKNKILNLDPLAGLNKLECLNLMHNQISDISALAGLTELLCLQLEGNKISGITELAMKAKVVCRRLLRAVVSIALKVLAPGLALLAAGLVAKCLYTRRGRKGVNGNVEVDSSDCGEPWERGKTDNNSYSGARPARTCVGMRLRNMTVKKKVIIAAAVLVTLAAVYLASFCGECHSFISFNGCTYYDSKQYCFGQLIWGRKWSDPSDAPYPTTESGIMDSGTFWRGFGLLWKKTVYYD